jgi:hypothetical protein
MTQIKLREAQDSRQLLRWFALLVAVGPIHMAEQLMFGLDTLYELRAAIAPYYSNFKNPDVGTVLLVIVVVVLVQVMVLAALAGGRARLCVAAFFGVMGVVEAHHILQTVAGLQYFPGVVTSVGYVWAGIMTLRCVRREWPSAEAAEAARRAIAV